MAKKRLLANNASKEALGAIEVYFGSYAQFNHNPRNEAWAEYHRMVRNLQWNVDGKKEKDARRRFRVAIVKQFGELYGTDENKLYSLQRLSVKLRISPVPETVESCKKAINKVYVNIMDFIDSERTGMPVVTFKNEEQLRTYTLKYRKIFPKKEAKDSSLLKYLLRRIFV